MKALIALALLFAVACGGVVETTGDNPTGDEEVAKTSQAIALFEGYSVQAGYSIPLPHQLDMTNTANTVCGLTYIRGSWTQFPGTYAQIDINSSTRNWRLTAAAGPGDGVIVEASCAALSNWGPNPIRSRGLSPFVSDPTPPWQPDHGNFGDLGCADGCVGWTAGIQGAISPVDQVVHSSSGPDWGLMVWGYTGGSVSWIDLNSNPTCSGLSCRQFSLAVSCYVGGTVTSCSIPGLTPQNSFCAIGGGGLGSFFGIGDTVYVDGASGTWVMRSTGTVPRARMQCVGYGT